MGKVTKLHSDYTASNWVRGNCIGKGSFGTVSLGVDKSDGRVFAVKSVDRTAFVPSQLEALETEIRILRSISSSSSSSSSSSPYVVEYLGDDVSYESTTSYRNLHLEYLPAGTAADDAADVDEATVRSRIWCLVSALRYVHSRGIVHCDVKGRNVLVGPTPGHAKLADFGSATEFVDAGCGAPILPRGSPLWMAPEVVRRESQGPESDVWSLGCTLIEMVTGKPAWEDRGADTLSRIGFSGELPEFPAGLSQAGRDFLEKCLVSDPTRRWSCDRLLEHPFLASVAPDSVAANSSPRCVLDWVNSEFDEEEGEVEDLESDYQRALSARERIGKLASKSGAIWESDGWTVVRSFSTSEGETTGAYCRWGEGEAEGASSEYGEFVRAEWEIVGTSSEYSDSSGTNLEYQKLGGGSVLHESEWACNCSDGGGGLGWCVAGSSCRHGFRRVDLAFDDRPGILI
ncbi:GPCR kinase [Trema orientale]|uniref:GPCR kinase n=1 Tax=Trema orientale TaxID=63057 RepID=A0A2P5EIS5_TREOI|nr:GPCR kinase [Trema orientale]